MKIPILAALVVFSTATPAQPVSVAPWMTGQRLVDLQRTPPGVSSPHQLTSAQYTDDQRAESYMDGVHDATEGKSWCYSYEYKPKPDTIKSQIADALRAMPAAQLKRNAADLIVEVLSAKYPCSLRSKP